MKESNKNRDSIKIILISLLIIQIACIFSMNLMRFRYVIDYDSSSVMMTAREIGRQMTLFPKDYGYQNTMDLHALAIPAAIIYRITGNIILSQGIACNLIVIIFLYILYCILSHSGMSDNSKLICTICFFLPWSTGMLGYMRSVFTAGAYNVHRLMIPVLILSIIMDQDEGKPFKKYAGRFLYLLYICFFAALSSGLYTLLCSILPLILWEVLNSFIKDDYSCFRSKRMITEGLVAAVSLAGFITEKMLGFSSHASEMRLISSRDFGENAIRCFTAMFELFGGLTERDDVALMSFQSVNILVNFILACLFIISLVFCVKRVVKNRIADLIDGYGLMLAAVNILVLLLLDTHYGSGNFEYRYHLITFSLIFLFTGRMLDDWKDALKDRQWNILSVIICCLIVLSMASGDVKWFLYSKVHNVDQLTDINSFLEDNGVGTAVYVGDENDESGRRARPLSETIDYIITGDDFYDTYETEWGGPVYQLDKNRQRGRYAIITQEDHFDALPEEVKKGMNREAEFGDLSVYIADNACFDFSKG